MKTVALLCPGPSLPEFWKEEKFEQYDLVVAVNGVARMFRCHWTCGTDKLIAELIDGKTGLRPACGFVTNKRNGAAALANGFAVVNPDPYYGVNMPRGLAIPRENCPDRCGYTMPNALWFALREAQGGQVDVYGMDFAVNRDDCDGTKGAHTAVRFRIEAAWLRGWWKPSIRVFSTAKPGLLAYLRRERSDWTP